jgi:hypothetical protein
VVEAIAEGRYELIHVWSPGPSGVIAALVARTMGLPIVGSYHADLADYAGALGAFYGQCTHVLSPSRSADATLRALGVQDERLGRWDGSLRLLADGYRTALTAAGRDAETSQAA